MDIFFKYLGGMAPLAPPGMSMWKYSCNHCCNPWRKKL